MTTERVMLLIDADNVSVDVMEQAVRLLMNQHGAVHVRRAYCTAEGAVKHQAVFKRLSIKPMVNLSAGKNSTDIALAVDAIDLVLAERPDVVVIASSDSDFAPLVARLREKGCVVRGIGQEGKTGDETQDAYDDYTVLAHRKGPAAAGSSPTAVARGATRGGARGGVRGGAGTRGGPSQRSAGRAAATAVDAAPASASVSAPASAEPAAAKPKADGQRPRQDGHRARTGTAAGRPALPSVHDAAEDEAAAEATLALLRLATDRAAAQQAAAAAQLEEASALAESVALDEAAAEKPAAAPRKAPRRRSKPGAKAAAAEAADADTQDVAESAAASSAVPEQPAPPVAKPARKPASKPARKPAASKGAASKSAAQGSPVPEAEAEADQTPPVAPEVLAAEVLATLAPPPVSAKATVQAAVPAVPQAAKRPGMPSSAVAALPDKVLEILASLPELARGDTVELRLASQRLRDAGLLSKSGSSTKLLGQFGDRFELLPPGQPNHVRLRGGKLV